MTAARRLTRPVLRWYGGKWLHAPWIVGQFPRHRIYVEPFYGAASVLLRKPRSYAEIINDLDDDVVGLFRVLRDPAQSAALIEGLTLTPFARIEFEAAYEPTNDPVERARRLIVRSFMGFGSDGTRVDLSTGFRANSNRSGTTPAQDWRHYPPALGAIVERLRGVVIEHGDALDCMLKHDGPDTLHYLDPPYLHDTRQTCHRGHGYVHELSDADHRRLLEALPALRGAVIISGYPHPLYDALLPGWRRVTRAAHADGARPRIEVLWLNRAADQVGCLLTGLAS